MNALHITGENNDDDEMPELEHGNDPIYIVDPVERDLLLCQIRYAAERQRLFNSATQVPAKYQKANYIEIPIQIDDYRLTTDDIQMLHRKHGLTVLVADNTELKGRCLKVK